MSKWPEYFMQIAKDTAAMSKDPNTKVGACIVKGRRILSVGYNGAPHGYPDEQVPNTSNSQLPLLKQKNSYMVHAELNAILNYRGNIADFDGATIYVTTSPCHECAKALIQVGIKTIVYDTKYHRKEITDVSDELFAHCGVTVMSMEELCSYESKNK